MAENKQNLTITSNPLFSNRQAEIHKKGFDMLKAPTSAVDCYAKLKVSGRSYGDAVLDIHHYDKMDKRYFRDKATIM